MAAEPFVQFEFNYLKNKSASSTAHVPRNLPSKPMNWQVTSDAAGKVVIRDHTGNVLGIGKWHFNATKERTRSSYGDKLDDARWDAIDELLYGMLEHARANGKIDPNLLDTATIDGVVTPPTPPPTGPTLPAPQLSPE